ncbi:MAG: KpsF/GutQ family sugar-phosphate isomerase [Clostridia bacterium]|nr:KpsF/GutQ family sugar-phosphate isomerase [Clostridia bacterium]
MDILSEAKRVFDIEIEALEKTKNALDETFVEILNLIVECKGKVIIAGMGKPGHIAEKLAATFASLGTPAFFLHPGEAMHGDLGMINESDIVIAMSYSGESEEIVRIIPNIKLIGAKLIGLTGNANSTLAREADITEVFPPFKEACYLGLAPTSSTTAELCYGDALAVVASGVYGFKDTDFAAFHPAGSLGKKLIIKVKDLMATGDKNAMVDVNAPLTDAIIEISKKGLGAVAVTDDNGNIAGIITDGDLRRQLTNGVDIYKKNVKEVMTASPETISGESLAVKALSIMKNKNISCLIVSDGQKAQGIIRLQDIVGVGIVG